MKDNEIKFEVSNTIPTKVVIMIDNEGKIYWKDREVETDEEFRKAMLDLAGHMRGCCLHCSEKVQG